MSYNYKEEDSIKSSLNNLLQEMEKISKEIKNIKSMQEEMKEEMSKEIKQFESKLNDLIDTRRCCE